MEIPPHCKTPHSPEVRAKMHFTFFLRSQGCTKCTTYSRGVSLSRFTLQTAAKTGEWQWLGLSIPMKITRSMRERTPSGLSGANMQHAERFHNYWATFWAHVGTAVKPNNISQRHRESGRFKGIPEACARLYANFGAAWQSLADFGEPTTRYSREPPRCSPEFW